MLSKNNMSMDQKIREKKEKRIMLNAKYERKKRKE